MDRDSVKIVLKNGEEEIFSACYNDDSINEINEGLELMEKNNDKIEELPEKEPFLCSQSKEQRELFEKFAIMCNSLAMHTVSYLSIRVCPQENKAVCYLFADSFALAPKQMLLLFNLCISSSNMEIMPAQSSEEPSYLSFSFSFDENDKKILNFLPNN